MIGVRERREVVERRVRGGSERGEGRERGARGGEGVGRGRKNIQVSCQHKSSIGNIATKDHRTLKQDLNIYS